MEYAIEINNLNHKFKDKIVCDNLSINFEKNKIYGLLGKNGAGKTTLINIMAYQLIPQEGNLKIMGKSPKEDISVVENICVVREKEIITNTNTEEKVKAVLKSYSYFYPDYDYEMEKRLCKLFEIDTKQKYRKLSRGMKTSVSNIIGICSNAPITIFDEPTIGLDAVNRKEFYDILLESYISNNRTIIVSTHHIHDIEEILEKVAILKDGKIIVDDYLEEISQKSYYINGKKDDLDRLDMLKDSKPIKKFGNTEMYYYYGDISDTDLDTIEKWNIDLESMKLEDLFVNINKKEESLYE